MTEQVNAAEPLHATDEVDRRAAVSLVFGIVGLVPIISPIIAAISVFGSQSFDGAVMVPVHAVLPTQPVPAPR